MTRLILLAFLLLSTGIASAAPRFAISNTKETVDLQLDASGFAVINIGSFTVVLQVKSSGTLVISSIELTPIDSIATYSKATIQASTVPLTQTILLGQDPIASGDPYRPVSVGNLTAGSHIHDSNAGALDVISHLHMFDGISTWRGVTYFDPSNSDGSDNMGTFSGGTGMFTRCGIYGLADGAPGYDVVRMDSDLNMRVNISSVPGVLPISATELAPIDASAVFSESTIQASTIPLAHVILIGQDLRESFDGYRSAAVESLTTGTHGHDGNTGALVTTDHLHAINQSGGWNAVASVEVNNPQDNLGAAASDDAGLLTRSPVYGLADGAVGYDVMRLDSALNLKVTKSSTALLFTSLSLPASVSVGVTATQLFATSNVRRNVSWRNNGSATIFFGDSSVTTANGFPVKAGESMEHADSSYAGFGIVASGTEDARVFEELAQ